ncbi:MAG TPA: hypothetical protein VFQ61_12425 [Polyangiaceae bacterium]|nr:hypothetical protein [Polyangiaceae bacterium]
MQSREPGSSLRTVTFLLFVAQVLRSAWLSDDAFYSIRAADNLAHGFGLTFNPGERVQVFTNPLWTLLLSTLLVFFKSAYFVALLAGVVASAGAVLLAATRIARTASAAAVGILLCCLSRAFVDFSTSGLENSLGFLLLASFFWAYWAGRTWRRQIFWLALFGGATAFNRLDAILIVAPALAHALFVRRSLRSLGLTLLGFAPLLGWLLIAKLYYGVALPNTAYAKLNLALPSGQVWTQGLAFFTDSLNRDPITLLTCAWMIVACFRRLGPAQGADDDRNQALFASLGALLYLVYVASVGGDFMSGRSLTLPFFVAVLVFVRCVGPQQSRAELQAVAAIAAATVFVLPHGTMVEHTECVVPDSGVVNERYCYETHTALLYNLHSEFYKTHPYWQEGARAAAENRRIVEAGAGLAAQAAGPRLYVLNGFAMGDALLSRIRFVPNGGWRIGHYFRLNPPGYLESLESGRNELSDPCMRRFYAELRVLIREPLFSWRRIRRVFSASELDSYETWAASHCSGLDAAQH